MKAEQQTKPQLSAVFDIGKTRSKLEFVDDRGACVYSAGQSSKVLEAGLYPQLDTEGTWQWMLQALRDSKLAADVTQCLVVTHGAAFALLDGLGEAVPVMDYEFDGFDSVNAAYEKQRDQFEHTFSPCLPVGLNAGRQIFYVQHNLPKEFSRVSSIVPYPQYWASRLCGELASEVTSLGSHTDLWCPEKRRFSSLVLNNGWDKLMPPIRPAWSVLGPVLPEVASKTGLNRACRIHCGVHDSNASYLRHLSAEQRAFTVVSTGTWVICMAAGHTLQTLDAGRDMLANVDVMSGPVPCARFMGGREFSALLDGIDDVEVVTLADAHSAMASGRFALPSFTSGGGPFPTREGELVRPGEDARCRAALASLYCALLTDVCLDNLGVSGDLVLEGRFVTDAVFVEALAQFRSHQKVRVSDDETGTVSGAQRLFTWPESEPVQPPEYTVAGPAADYLVYRNRWRELLCA